MEIEDSGIGDVDLQTTTAGWAEFGKTAWYADIQKILDFWIECQRRDRDEMDLDDGGKEFYASKGRLEFMNRFKESLEALVTTEEE